MKKETLLTRQHVDEKAHMMKRKRRNEYEV